MYISRVKTGSNFKKCAEVDRITLRKTFPQSFRNKSYQACKRGEMTIQQNCLFRGTNLVVPRSFRKAIFEALHKLCLGVSRFKATLRQHVLPVVWNCYKSRHMHQQLHKLYGKAGNLTFRILCRMGEKYTSISTNTYRFLWFCGNKIRIDSWLFF